MDLSHWLDYVRHMQDHLRDLLTAWGPWFYGLLFLVVFCETGLVVTPFLPGDSLLFAVGALAADPQSTLSLGLLFALLSGAAILGDAVNYALGYRLGPRVFKYEQSWLFNKKHLLRAQQFYEKYGSKTIILARFIPIIRTFAPFVAGIGKMHYRRFVLYNCLGGLVWVAVCLFSGYYFGQIKLIRDNFELVVVAILLISVAPMAIEFLLAWRRSDSAETPTPSTPPLPKHISAPISSTRQAS